MYLNNFKGKRIIVIDNNYYRSITSITKRTCLSKPEVLKDKYELFNLIIKHLRTTCDYSPVSYESERKKENKIYIITYGYTNIKENKYLPNYYCKHKLRKIENKSDRH